MATTKSRSGTTRTYAERKASGRPIVSVTMSAETKALLDELSEMRGESRSAVIDEAIQALAKRSRKK